MGSSTTSDICKNVLQLGDKNEIINVIEEFYETYEFDDTFKSVPFLRGWKIYDYDEKIGQNNRLHSLRLTKGEHKVFMINSSEYSSVGEHWYEITSDNRDSVVEFRKDFDDLVHNRTIVPLDSICQTG